MTPLIAPTGEEVRTPPEEAAPDLRAAALERLDRKRDFHAHLLAFALVNALLWVVWGLVLAAGGPWIPWPVFPLLGWGIGLAFHARYAYGRIVFSEDEIQREIERLRPLEPRG